MARGTVLVTGTSTGIGRATAVHLAGLGFDVLAGVRREGDGEAVRELSPQRIEPIVLDVTVPEQVEAARARVQETGLAGLVNNAGVTVQGPVEFVDLDDFRRQMEVNLVGPLALTQAVLPQLRASRGRIAMVSSIGGRWALPFLAPYNASKFALEGLSDSLRMELRPLGVHVAVIEPGSVATEIWRKGEEASREAIESMPPEARETYGARLEKMADAAAEAGARGIAPEKVAEVIAHALTASRPRTRYLVGTDARMRGRLKKLLPDRVADTLTLRASGTG
jgi:NAD(P)-dependent dehydrogenase (short-subunit alcohol dehydrogenase family)